MKQFEQIIKDVTDEVEKVSSIFPDYTSYHEASAITREEFEELWDEVKAKDHDHAKIYKEAKHLACTAVRTMCLAAGNIGTAQKKIVPDCDITSENIDEVAHNMISRVAQRHDELKAKEEKQKNFVQYVIDTISEKPRCDTCRHTKSCTFSEMVTACYKYKRAPEVKTTNANYDKNEQCLVTCVSLLLGKPEGSNYTCIELSGLNDAEDVRKALRALHDKDKRTVRS